VVANLGRDGFPGGQRDVRRVGDHRVDLPVELGQAAVDVALVQRRARAGEVAAGPHAGLRGQLDSVDRAVRALGRDGSGDGARAAAQVHDQRRLDVLQAVEHPADQDLGLRARDEHTGPDDQFAVAESGRTGQVLEGFALGATIHQYVVLRELSIREVHQAQLQPRGARHEGEQLGGVVLR
jgi:hypothetical protein